MGHFLHFHPITVAAFLIFAVALWKGGPAERLGAALMGLDWIAAVACSALTGREILVHVRLPPASVLVFLDFFFSLGLLALAVRFGRLWLGSALILQGLTLAMHAMALSPDAPGFVIYVAALNGITCLLLLTLLTGALSAWRRRAVRRGLRREAALLPAAA